LAPRITAEAVPTIHQRRLTAIPMIWVNSSATLLSGSASGKIQ
jgi:hypothetical protein